MTETLLTNARTDIQAIIVDQGITATLVRQTETADTMGGVSAVSETEYTIKTLIQDITKKDRQIHEMGLALPGNSKAFFYHEYSATITGSIAITVQAGDIIVYGDKRWRVEQIVAERLAQGEVAFITGIIHKIDLDQ